MYVQSNERETEFLNAGFAAEKNSNKSQALALVKVHFEIECLFNKN